MSGLLRSAHLFENSTQSVVGRQIKDDVLVGARIIAGVHLTEGGVAVGDVIDPHWKHFHVTQSLVLNQLSHSPQTYSRHFPSFR